VLTVKTHHYLRSLLVLLPILMLALFAACAVSLGKPSKDTLRYTPQETIHLLSSLTSKEDISALRRVLLSQNDTWAQLTVQVLDSKSPKEAAKALSEIKDLSEIGSSISTTPSLGIQIIPNVPPYLVP
jgi:hypothetical protein